MREAFEIIFKKQENWRSDGNEAERRQESSGPRRANFREQKDRRDKSRAREG
jgi:hypothetical protein